VSSKLGGQSFDIASASTDGENLARKNFQGVGLLFQEFFSNQHTLFFIKPVKLVNEINELTPERFNYFQFRASLNLS
jgi:hypothetical protein